MNGQPRDELAALRIAADVAALRTEADYVRAETPDGRDRRNGGRHAILALLASVSASRLVSLALATPQPWAIRSYLREVATVLQAGGPLPPAPVAADPVQHLLVQCADELLRCSAALHAGFAALEGKGGRLPEANLPIGYDVEGAGWAAVRATVAAGACAAFSVLAGWNGATLVLIQGSAIIALVGTLPNPAAAALTFPVALAPVAFLVGSVTFLVLPGASGFVPFALVVGALTGAAALTHRRTSLARYAPAALLLTSYLLGPSNRQGYDFASYANTVLQVAVDLVFVVLAFRLIPGASAGRRRSHVAARITGGLRRTLKDRSATTIRPLAASTRFDLMARMLAAVGARTPARVRRLRHMRTLGDFDAEVRQALLGLPGSAELRPDLAPLLAAAGCSLRAADPDQILEIARALLEAGPVAVRDVAARMAAAALLIRHDPSGFRLFHRTME